MEIFKQSSDSPIFLAISKIELLKVLLRIIFNPGTMVGTWVYTKCLLNFSINASVKNIICISEQN